VVLSNGKSEAMKAFLFCLLAVRFALLGYKSAVSEFELLKIQYGPNNPREESLTMIDEAGFFTTHHALFRLKIKQPFDYSIGIYVVSVYFWQSKNLTFDE